MEFLYCSDPLNPKHVDMNYEVEEQIAHKLGFFSSLFSYEELAEFGNPTKALKSVPSSEVISFTMDIAKSKDGGWCIVELGDDQVAGLPEHADIQEFYRQIHIVSHSLSHNG